MKKLHYLSPETDAVLLVTEATLCTSGTDTSSFEGFNPVDIEFPMFDIL